MKKKQLPPQCRQHNASPSPEEILAHMERIRSGWSENQERARRSAATNDTLVKGVEIPQDVSVPAWTPGVPRVV